MLVHCPELVHYLLHRKETERPRQRQTHRQGQEFLLLLCYLFLVLSVHVLFSCPLPTNSVLVMNIDDDGGGGGGDLLDINPPAGELRFRFELKQQSSCSVLLTNKTWNEYVAFKVQTTNPRKYCVKPNTGILLPKKICNITITMQGQKEAPMDMLSKDKFLLRSAAVPYGTTLKDVTPKMFNKDDGKVVEEFKWRVMHVDPPPPPMPVASNTPPPLPPPMPVAANTPPPLPPPMTVAANTPPPLPPPMTVAANPPPPLPPPMTVAANPPPPSPMTVPDQDVMNKVMFCQICGMDSHSADGCPFLYTPCKVPNCSGIRKLYISTIENNPRKKFLKCQYNQCMGFQLLSDAISEANGSISSSSMLQQQQVCFQCGDTTHSSNECPMVVVLAAPSTIRPTKKELKASKKKEGCGGRKCLKCFCTRKHRI